MAWGSTGGPVKGHPDFLMMLLAHLVVALPPPGARLARVLQLKDLHGLRGHVGSLRPGLNVTQRLAIKRLRLRLLELLDVLGRQLGTIDLDRQLV